MSLKSLLTLLAGLLAALPLGTSAQTGSALGEALDNTDLSWSTSGDGLWLGQNATYYYGGDAAQSSTIADDEATHLDTVVSGPGTLSFYWKVSSEAGYDFLIFALDGTQLFATSGSSYWQQKTVSIPSGQHALRWSYTKDVMFSAGSDAGWVDKVVYTPAPTEELSVDRLGSGTVTSSPGDIECGTTCTGDFTQGTSVMLTATPATDHAFTGWGGACSGTALTCTITMDATKSVTATFTLIPSGPDTDGDGIPDSEDIDDDNDGIADWADPDPLNDQVGLDPLFIASGPASINHTWKAIDAPSGYVDAVVIAGVPTYHGGDPGVVRLRDVTDTGFELRFKEWDYRQDAGDNYHAVEQVDYVVLQPGRHTMTDGSVWEVGTLDVDGTGIWQGHSFASPFGKAPHLILTIQTENDPEGVSVRARNVTSDGFAVALFEEEQRMGGDGHGVETVGYLAVYSPAGGGLIDVDGEQVPYLLQTLKADERWSPVLSHRLKVEEEQSRDSETGHVDETLHVLALGQALFAQQVSHSGGDTTALRRLEPTEEAPMEWGVLRDITHQWQVLPFAKTYDDPVVVVKPVSSDGSHPSVIRLRNITTTDAEVRVQEWNYLDGSHTTENVFYLVSEATTPQSGPYSLGGLRVQAGWVDTNALALAGGWASVDFTESFGDVPAVFASVMTYAGGDAVTTRIDGLDATGFSIAMDEQENKDPYHVTETLGWIAIDRGSGTTNGRKLKVFTTALDDTLTAVGYDDALVPFTTGHRHPTVVGDINSTYEADPVFLRYASPTNTQIQLKLTEETSADAETSHVPEDVGIFVGE